MLESENAALKATIAKQATEIKKQATEIEWLRQKVDTLARMIYGAKSEKIDPDQLKLLLSGLDGDGAKKPEASENGGIPEPGEAAGRSGAKTKAKKRENHSRIKNLDNLPIEEVTVLPPEVEAEPEAYEQIGVSVTKQLDYIPGRCFVRHTLRPKFRRKDDRTIPPLLAPAPPSPLPGGLPAPGFVAELIIGRFLQHLPLYRQAEGFARGGIEIPRDLLDHWMLRTLELLVPLADAIHVEVLGNTYFEIDETPHRYLEPGHRKAKLGYLWVMHVPDINGRGQCCYRWNPSRSGAALREVIGSNYRGTLGTDGYNVYIILRNERPGDVTLASCMTHIRRKFEAALDASPREAAYVLGQIGQLYRLESELRKARAGPALRVARRAHHAAPVLNRLKKIFQILQPRHRPQSPMGKALSYGLARLKDMAAYLTDGRVELDNNLVENDIRPIKLGAKNSLFIGSVNVGHLYAAGYTIVENAERRGLDVRTYLIESIIALATHGTRIAAQITPLKKTTHPRDIRRIAG